MAIETSQLILEPILVQYFTDPNTLLPQVGTVTFFKTDKVTLKNIYQQTGNPLDPFEVAENPQTLGVDGGFQQILYAYPFDEADNVTIELYYVEIRDASNTLIRTIDNWPENFNAEVPEDDSTGLTNLCPSFGFDFPIFGTFYNVIDNQFVTENETNVARGWVWYKDAPTNSDIFYSFESIDEGTLDGNPNFEINLDITNSGAPQSINWIGFPLVASNELSGSTVNFQFYATDKSTVPVTSLDIAVALEDVWTPTTVGVISLTTARTLFQVSFTMPDLSAQFTSDSQKVFLVIELPLSQDFSIAFTGTFSYVGDQQTDPNITTDSFGNRTSRQLFANLNENLQGNNNSSATDAGLALADFKGQINTRDSTGTIFISSNTKEFNYAVQLSQQTIVRNQFLLPGILTNRFLDESGNLAGKAGDAFNVTNASGSVFDIATVAATTSHSEWVSQTAAVTIVNSSGVADFGISSTIDGSNDRLLHITFSDDFLALVGPYNIDGHCAGGTTWNPGPADSVILDYVGSIATTANTTYPLIFTKNTDITVTTTNNGSPSGPAQPAQCDIEFAASAFTTGISTVKETFSLGITDYFTVYRNALLYLNLATANTGTMPAIPPFAIQFSNNGVGDSVPTTAGNITVNLTSSEFGNGSAIAGVVNNAINTTDTYTITVNSLPSNGDVLNISTADADLNVIFYDTAQAKPSNPNPSRFPVYVTFTSSDTTDTLATNLATTLLQDVGGIPSVGDLLETNDLPILPDELAYFVEI